MLPEVTQQVLLVLKFPHNHKHIFWKTSSELSKYSENCHRKKKDLKILYEKDQSHLELPL